MPLAELYSMTEATVPQSETSAPPATTRRRIPPPHFSILLSVEQVAVYLGGVSERKVWGLVSAGKLPAPKKIDRLTRWKRSDLDKWADAL